MTGNRSLLLFTTLALVACGQEPSVAPPLPGDLSAEILPRQGATPPATPAGACWAADHLPAAYETVTEQTLLAPESRDETGQLVTPASYRSVSKLSQIRKARDIWFQTPCPDALTLPFVASLQRALKARGYFLAEVTGTLDAGTSEAIRRYQAEHGLDSAQLSLAAAKDLGLATTALEDL